MGGEAPGGPKNDELNWGAAMSQPNDERLNGGRYGPTAATLPDNWRAWYEERAGILEFNAGMPRLKAQLVAFDMTLREMRKGLS